MAIIGWIVACARTLLDEGTRGEASIYQRQYLPPTPHNSGPYGDPVGGGFDHVNQWGERWTVRNLLAFWVPLALSWFMMSIAQPVVSIAISRLAQPDIHLAAYGVTVDLALMLEGPIIMFLSASVALVRDQHSFRLLRRFVLQASVVLTVVYALVIFTPLYGLVVTGLMGVPDEIARHARQALWVLLPWITSIAVRRLYQGPLILAGRTRLVTFGTMARLGTLAGVLFLGVRWPLLPGSLLGGVALSASVIVEAIAEVLWALPVVRHLPQQYSERLAMGAIIRFCLPLSSTDVMRVVSRPAIVAGVARAALPTLSLAAWPVAHGLSQLIGSSTMAFQEVVVAATDNQVAYRRIRTFVLTCGVVFSALAALIAFTPAATWYLREVVHLPPELRPHVIDGLRLLVPMPALFAVRNLLRGVLIRQRRTILVQSAMMLNIGTLALGLILGVTVGLSGVAVAALGLLAAQVAEIGALLSFFRGAVRTLPVPEAS